MLKPFLILFFIESVQQLCSKSLELKTQGPLFNLCVQFEKQLRSSKMDLYFPNK
jgi:hypothetical protein